MKNRFVLFSFILFFTISKGNVGQYDFHVIKNIVLGNKYSAANCFTQDSLGMMWIGTNNGLYNYNGYTSKIALIIDPKFKTFVYSLITLSSTHLAVGTGNGLFFYNYRDDTYEEISSLSQKDIRCLLLDSDKLWVGTLNGLFVYDLNKKTLTKNFKLGNETIYALKKMDNKLFVGTYNGLFEVTLETKKIRNIHLPDYGVFSNQFINSLYVQDKNLWIGTEKGIYQLKEDKVLKISSFNHMPIKSLFGDVESNLLIGTDNGLYVYNNQKNSRVRIIHDSRNFNSLANNIIWQIYVDRNNTIWIGTEAGFSIWSPKSKEKNYPIYAITNSSNGNNIYHIHKDSFGWFWLGGDNGLIKTKNLENNAGQTHWYSVDNRSFFLPHNRIRKIYEDKSQNLWIASDGGINLFNRKNNTFMTFEITDVTKTKSAKWAYDILEDRRGNLWISSYLGGVFVVNKQQLLSNQYSIIADENYTKQNGLLADFANQLIEDDNGNIWILIYHTGLLVIDPKKNQSIEIKDEKGQSLKKASYFIKDKEGNFWVGEAGSVIKIDRSNTISRIILDHSSNNHIKSLADVGDKIWVSYENSIWAIDKKDFRASIIKYNINAHSIFADAGQVFLGGNDVIVSLNKKSFDNDPKIQPIFLTSVFVNNQLLDQYNQGIRYKNEFRFKHNENNLRLEFSDLDYEDKAGARYAYRFKNVENDEWIPLEVGDNKLILANLASDDYYLQVTKVNMQGEVLSKIYAFKISILHPWYTSIYARIIYTLLLLGFILWVINFFRVKNRLRLERHARRNIQEVTKLKLDFFTSISHDLKTPLSLIIGPISQIIHQTKNIEKKKELELIQKNALKIHSLIDEVGNFDKLNRSENEIIYSSVSLIGFINQILERFAQGDGIVDLQLNNESDSDLIYLKTDVIKLESILSNCISNGLKYNDSSSKEIKIDIKASSYGLKIQISDNGLGILEEEMPYIFSKFYRSNQVVAHQKEGTGLGLYIVKTFCDQLGWSIDVKSIVNTGTTIILSIPELYILKQLEEHMTSIALFPSRRKLLLVEDNIELSSFIHQVLKNEYECFICDSGIKTLEVLDSGFKPEIILSDFMMPGMDGLEMIKLIKKKKHLSTIPIILLTAQNEKQLAMDSATLGVDTIVTKPFDVEFLKAKILQLLNKQDNLIEKIKLDSIQEPKSNTISSIDERFLSRVTKYIEDNIDDSEFSVQKLSESIDIPAKQLYRKIKNILGLTPVEYIRKIRLKSAAVLLAKQNFSIAEVMYMVGFSNASYFSKCFHQEFGLTPKQFMEQQKDDTNKK